MKLLRAALAVAITLLVAGCLPVTSKTPVGTTAGLGADPALYGTWKGRSADSSDKDKSYGYFHFMKGKDGSISAVMVLATGSDDDGWTVFNVRTVTLGKNHFINAVETFDKDAPADGDIKNANIPLLYTIKGGLLKLYLIDEEKAKEAVQSGAIKGTVEPGQSGDVQITADAAELDAFMAKPEAANVFKSFIVLKKVN